MGGRGENTARRKVLLSLRRGGGEFHAWNFFKTCFRGLKVDPKGPTNEQTFWLDVESPAPLAPKKTKI